MSKFIERRFRLQPNVEGKKPKEEEDEGPSLLESLPPTPSDAELFAGARQEWLDKLAKYPDDRTILIESLGEFIPVAAGDFRTELLAATPQDPGYAYTTLVADTPEKVDYFLRRDATMVAQFQEHCRKLAEGMPDDQLVWILDGNTVHRITAGELRTYGDGLDARSVFADGGGIRLLSADPDFDADEWIEQHNHERHERTARGIDEAVENVKWAASIRDSLRATIHNLQFSPLVRITFPDGRTVDFSPKQALVYVESLTVSALLDEGVPSINLPENADEGFN